MESILHTKYLIHSAIVVVFVFLGPHTMVFEKTPMFVFRKVSILQIKFPNLRFEDIHFFRIFVNISRTKKSSAEDFFVREIVRPKIFFFENFYEDFEIFFSENVLFGRRFFRSLLTFFVRTNNFSSEKKLKMAQNVCKLARIFG